MRRLSANLELVMAAIKRLLQSDTLPSQDDIARDAARLVEEHDLSPIKPPRIAFSGVDVMTKVQDPKGNPQVHGFTRLVRGSDADTQVPGQPNALVGNSAPSLLQCTTGFKQSANAVTA